MEELIELNLSAIKHAFENVWSNHSCENRTKGCGKGNRVLVCDGGLKNTRRICCALSAGVKSFETTEAQVRTGCIHIPATRKKSCSIHENSTPSIPGKKVSKRTKAALAEKTTDGMKGDIYEVAGIHAKK